ncbi:MULTISPECIES: MCE family protein [Gordonia]|uniref:MCE family protein n=2 Tax=Gordonia rubripertincta TaxID=36822 RepID=A0AAW6RB61_GORRU|nr:MULTISPECIES: MCE family protein [Gordonia]MBR7191496.1 MCE family protein [Gordonia sp. SCSIO 19800]MDG6782669.1 MCE family protein [Gordonia rubripertincta]MDJ0008539.1 MCE family protein [Gordonia alkanivorans]MDJ0098557.1 MCE family protein [Gordonia alkanivorans]MDJ0494114.1 MCE family protein [Gordonia alkanivorans]
MNRRSVRTTLAGAALSLTVMVSGCMSGGIQSIPLPGGVDTGSSPRTYKIQFDDVLDLVPQSMVKRDGIPVGRVTKVEVPNDAWFAQVTVEVQNDVDLSDEAQASVQQTSLLGEKFVSLSDPDNSANAPRQNPAEPIPVDRTRTATDIEQVLGALALLLTGGGINQLQPIVSELNKTLGGRTDEVRSLIDQTEKLIAGLNRQRDDIVAAIDGLADLSARTEKQTAQIDRILKQLPEGIEVLEEQRPQFVDLLTKLDQLGQVGTDVLGKSRTALINDLKALRPILSELTKAAPDLITAAPLMLTLPFPDWVLPAFHGDSANLFMTLDLRILNQLEALGVGQGTPKYSPPARVKVPVNPRNPYYNGNGPRYGWPTITLLPPAPNSRPGPNTPPSGGTYPASAPVPAAPGQGVLDSPLAAMGLAPKSQAPESPTGAGR